MRVAEAHRFQAFGGARCQIIAVDAPASEVSAAVAEAYAFESRLSRFIAESELSGFNRAAGVQQTVSPLLEALLRAALDAYVLSGGLVNAAVLPALIVSGYDRSIEQVRRIGGKRASTASGSASAPPLPDVLEVGTGTALLRAGCAVDLGGVGKGWLADRLCERLADAVVDLGGDIRAMGEGPDGAGWCIGLCDGSAVLVRDAGVATSGTVGRRWSSGHHLVDPRSGKPAATDVASASVVAVDALHAEVLAKMAAVTGSEHGPVLARRHGAVRVAVVRDTSVGEGA